MDEKKYPLVIDSHVHVGIRPDMAFEGHDLIPELDAAQQDMAVVFPMMENFVQWRGADNYNPYNGNDYIAQIQAEYPSRLIGLGSVNPWLQRNYQYGWKEGRSDKVTRSPAIEEVERALMDLGLWGLKFHPLLQGFSINDPLIMLPIFDKVLECQRKTNRRMLIVVHCMADSLLNSPDAVAAMAKRYPELTFSLVHMGLVWGGFTLIDVVRDVPNLLLDTTWVPNFILIKSVLDALGPQRIIGGTDAPWGSFKAKMLAIEECVPENHDRELILGGNLAELFGIEPINEQGTALGGKHR